MGRGSASAVVVASALLVAVMMMIQTEVCNAKSPATFVVGDSTGWNFMCNSWPQGKRFRPGDFIVFKYDSSFHSVIPVDRVGYKTCNGRPGSRTFQSGKERFRLHRGMNYFICGIHAHCQTGGMKIAIKAY